METETNRVRRRIVPQKKSTFPLYYQIAVLFRTHTNTRLFCTLYSIVYRIAICCELSISGHLSISNDRIVVNSVPEDPIMSEVINKISLMLSSKPYMSPLELIQGLNGEKGSKKFMMKKCKNKIYNLLIEDKIVEKHSKVPFLSSIILFKNNSVWESVFTDMLEEFKMNKCSLSNIVILLCLNHVNDCSDIFEHCVWCDRILINKAIDKFTCIAREYKDGPDLLTFQFLRLIVN